MASLDLRWRPSTKKDLRRIPRDDVALIIAAVEALAEEPQPHGSDMLTDSEYTYRIQVRDYREIYEVLRPPGLVEIKRVRHRKDIYR